MSLFFVGTSHFALQVSLVWPAFPTGVKFDPTDLELLEHLQEKSCSANLKPHELINKFIPTIEEVEGICYTHPKNLPGIKMDGSSLHFFHKVSNAYGSGHRKRRRVIEDTNVSHEHIRWHKTGKSKVIRNEHGNKIGWKKILVLYKGSKRGDDNTTKDNWVMHQYHLGLDEDETTAEFVVSKIFYQVTSKKNGKSIIDNADVVPNVEINPTTSKTNLPQPHHLNDDSSITETSTPPQVDQGDENCGMSIYQTMNKGGMSPVRFDEPQTLIDMGFPAMNELMQSENAWDAGHEMVYDELSELDQSRLGAPGTSTVVR
ncbi:hypothetical protein U9M48_032959 [Paspalum notatum var. saurae]|uniref:NAC domain-containing protein n=1 Tax=Paspalum notatum var. saurae TaxID=547442 RepID=A0AAQ3X621_PASNO